MRLSKRLGWAGGAGALAALAIAGAALAWGHTGHRDIGYLAIESLPADLPVFLRASADDVAELARELDRPKGSGAVHDKDRDPGHYIDLDDNARSDGGPSIDSLPPTREAYEAALGAVGSNSWHAGYLPYSIISSWQQLKTDLAYWRVLNEALKIPSTPERRAWLEGDLRRRQALILSDIGALAHYVGDGSQPLHVSLHYNGWGDFPNPNNYTRAAIHGPFEGEFVARNVTLEAVRAAMAPYRDCACPIEQRTAQYLRTSWTFVEPLYQLWGQGAFNNGDPRGRDFAVARVAAGASELRDLIIEAWKASETQKVGWPAINAQDVANGKDAMPSLRGGD